MHVIPLYKNDDSSLFNMSKNEMSILIQFSPSAHLVHI